MNRLFDDLIPEPAASPQPYRPSPAKPRVDAERARWRCMELVAAHGPLTAVDLEDATGWRADVVTLAIEQLESVEAIVRTGRREDRRGVMADEWSATDKGREAVK